MCNPERGFHVLGSSNCETATTFVGSWEAQRSGAIRRPSRMRPRRPWGLRTAKLSPVSWAPGRPGGVVSYAHENEASPSLGAANCEADATFGTPGRSGGTRRPESALTVPWGCELRKCRHFRGLLGGPEESCHMQTRMRPRRPWGRRTAKLPQRSGAPGRSSGLVPYADQKETSPSLGAANCETVAGFGGS